MLYILVCISLQWGPVVGRIALVCVLTVKVTTFMHTLVA